MKAPRKATEAEVSEARPLATHLTKDKLRGLILGALLADEFAADLLYPVLSVVVEGRCEKDTLKAALHSWAKSNHKPLDKKTEYLFWGYSRVSTFSQRLQALRTALPGYEESHSALMRVVPFVLIADDDLRRSCVLMNNALTEEGHLSGAACLIFTRVLRLCAESKEVETARSDLRRELLTWAGAVTDPQLARCLVDAVQTTLKRELGQAPKKTYTWENRSDWVLHTLAASISVAFQAGGFAVVDNLPGHGSTGRTLSGEIRVLRTLAGAVFGALHGEEKLLRDLSPTGEMSAEALVKAKLGVQEDSPQERVLGAIDQLIARCTTEDEPCSALAASTPSAKRVRVL